jgi:hypothetical protein
MMFRHQQVAGEVSVEAKNCSHSAFLLAVLFTIWYNTFQDGM